MRLKFTVQAIENQVVVLQDSSNQAVVWPKNKLPEDLQVGQAIYFVITGVEAENIGADLSAEELLNNILQI